MSVPAQRRTSGSARRRRSHHALSSTTLTTCQQCKQKTLPHKACVSCGSYRGRSVAHPRIARRAAKAAKVARQQGEATK